MATFAVHVDHTNIPIGIGEIAGNLPAKESVRAGDSVRLVFEGRQFVYLTGLVLLATWRKSLPDGVECSIDDTRCPTGTLNLLLNSGFREVIETGHERPSVQKRLGRLPLCPITNRFNKDATVQDVASIFDDYAGHVADTKPFATMLSELCENVLAHSEAVSPGYVGARVIETQHSRMVEIAVCDTGIGFHGSFAGGTNEKARARIQRGASPIELALEGLNSSKPTPIRGSYMSYYGFGLFIVRRLVEENRGQMCILSGNEMISLDRFGRRRYEVPKAFQGAFVGLVLDLNNPLPLEQIYEQAAEALAGAPTDRTAAADRPDSGSHLSEMSNRFRIPAAVTDGINESTSNRRDAKMELKHFGAELLTREAGMAVRAELATRLLTVDKVVIQLDGVSDITPSVADEAFAKLAEKIGYERFSRLVVFEGGSTLVRRLIDFVIRTRIK